ncbi:Flagellar biosynthetic protein fliR [Desulfamplus magnetovallimortis]|uniref:Flagellar biosynthetic protein FliR n=1 Tax=Desulfamplus magnetovallimortis TaxID=1246637 RepID=A0A1W1HA02_9BACT|nr:flagellar biosynthetic protein FliR [Desulfamplus magnetovallimortis]SLM29245.1 Flagellar biosynthetic protein fliR [Desulfamplus magnetovallimortis]
MPILNLYNVEEFKVFLLVLARFSVVLFMLPIFGARTLPNMVKAALAMVLSLLLYSVVPVEPSIFPDTVIETGILIFFEIMIGLMLGTCIRLFLAAVQLSGQVIGFQMGFSMINVVDPQSGANVSIMEQIAYWVCLLVFLLFNGHYILLISVIESFELVPPGTFMLQRPLLDTLLNQGSQVFILGIKIGAPIIASLFFTSVSFGLIGKFAPQMNIMIVAFPMKIFVGLLLFGLALETIKIITREYIYGLKSLLLSLLFWAGGG